MLLESIVLLHTCTRNDDACSLLHLCCVGFCCCNFYNQYQLFLTGQRGLSPVIVILQLKKMYVMCIVYIHIVYIYYRQIDECHYYSIQPLPSLFQFILDHFSSRFILIIHHAFFCCSSMYSTYSSINTGHADIPSSYVLRSSHS